MQAHGRGELRRLHRLAGGLVHRQGQVEQARAATVPEGRAMLAGGHQFGEEQQVGVRGDAVALQ